MTDPPLPTQQEQHEAVGGTCTWFEDRSENWTNVANEPPHSANLLLPPSTETTVGDTREPTMEHAVPLMGAGPDLDQYPPSLLPSRTELDMNLETVEMDLDSGQDLEQPDDEIVPPTDAEFSTQQIEQLQNVVGQLLELEAHVKSTMGHLATESYDYEHSSVLVPPPPFESTEFLPPAPPLHTQEVEVQRQAQHFDFPQTQPVCDPPSYEEYVPLSILSDHTPSLPPSVPPAESVSSNIVVEPIKNSTVDTNVDIVNQLPSLHVNLPGSSKATSTGDEQSETTCADRSIQPLENILPDPQTPPSESLSNVPQETVSASSQNMTEISVIQGTDQNLTRDISLSPGEITPSPEPSPLPPPSADSNIQGTEKLGSFAHFSAEEHTSVLSHLSYNARMPSSPLRNMSSSGLSSPTQLRSGRPDYSRRYRHRSQSRSLSPRRRYYHRSHSRTPSPRRSLRSYRGRASRSPSPSRQHHRLSSTSGSRSSYRSHHSGSTGSRRVDSPVTRRRYRRSRSRSLSPTRGRRSRRSRSHSPSQRTGKYSRSQSTSPSRGRRSRLSRSPERRRGYDSLVRSRSGRRRSRTGSRSSSPRAVPKPSTESESEEDIELLRLKREAIMSMIKNEDAVKSADIGGSEEKTSYGEEVSLKASHSTVEDFSENIPTVASVSANKEHKGDEVEIKEEVEKRVVEEEGIGKADMEEGKPDAAMATDDTNKNRDTGTGQALSVCSKTTVEVEVKVDHVNSKSADESHPQPQEPIKLVEPVKPVEPAQRSLSQPVRRPAEVPEGVQLTAQTVVRSRSSSRRSSPTHQIRSHTGSPALTPPPSSSAAVGQKTRSLLPANKGSQTLKPASSAKVCCNAVSSTQWKLFTIVLSP